MPINYQDGTFNLSHFKFWCQRIIPLVFDNSLSYYEALCKVSEKLNEVIDALNEYGDNLKDYVDQRYNQLLAEVTATINAYQAQTDSKLNGMQNQIDGIESSVNDKISQLERDVDNKINQLETDVKNSIAQSEANVKQQIAEMTAYVTAQISIINLKLAQNLQQSFNYTDVQIQKLKDSIPDLTTVWVYSPATGNLVKIQDALYEMYDNLRCCALTAWEYDTLLLEAQRYDNLKLTAFEYDMYAKSKLWYFYPIHKVFSGVTGNLVPLQQGEYELWQNQRVNGVTANVYDTNAVTANQYDSAEIPAYNYDWNGGI